MVEPRALLRFAMGLCAGLVLIAIDTHAARAEPSRAGRVEFEVLRGGRHFGIQSVTVTSADGALVAQTQANLRADLGPVNVFRYSQTCRETWREARLLSLQCTTTKSGRRQVVSARVDGGQLRVSGVGTAQNFAAETWPTTWWTRPRLGSYVLINTETGAELPVRVTRIGRENINAGGQQVNAEHIRVQGSLTLELWYADDGAWVGSAFTIGGQRITYRLISPLGAGPA